MLTSKGSIDSSLLVSDEIVEGFLLDVNAVQNFPQRDISFCFALPLSDLHVSPPECTQLAIHPNSFWDWAKIFANPENEKFLRSTSFL